MTNIFYKLCQKHNLPYLRKGESCPRCFTDQRAHAVYIGADKEPHEWRKIRAKRDAVEERVVQKQANGATLDWVRSDGAFHRKMELVTACAKASLVKGDSTHHDLKEHYVQRGLHYSNYGEDYLSWEGEMADILGTLFDEKFPSFKPFLVAEVPRTEPVTTQSRIIKLNNDEEFQRSLRESTAHLSSAARMEEVRACLREPLRVHGATHRPLPSGFRKLALTLYENAWFAQLNKGLDAYLP